MTHRILVICTANVCRSPVAQRVLQRRLGAAVVRSAGTAHVLADVDPHTIAAAHDIGIDITTHTSRHVDRAILADDGADLVLTMSREHLREVVAIDPGVWPRTFTLKELARRSHLAAAEPGEQLRPWLRRLADGRRPDELMGADRDDDIADPYGGPRQQHVDMIAEVSNAVDVIVAHGPWDHSTDGTP